MSEAPPRFQVSIEHRNYGHAELKHVQALVRRYTTRIHDLVHDLVRLPNVGSLLLDLALPGHVPNPSPDPNPSPPNPHAVPISRCFAECTITRDLGHLSRKLLESGMPRR